MKTIWKVIRKNELKYIRFTLFYLCAAAAIAVSNVYIASTEGLIGQSASEFDRQNVIRLLLVLAAYTSVKVVFSALSALFSKRFAGKTEYKMRVNFAKHFTYIPFGAFGRKNSGEMLSLYSNDLPSASKFISTDILKQLGEIIALILSAVFLALMNPLLTLIYFAMYPLLIFLQTKISAPMGEHMQKVSVHRADFNAVVNDCLQNPSTVIAYSLEDAMEKRYLESYDKYFKVFMKYIETFSKLAISGVLASVLPTIIVTLFAAFYVVNGKMNIAEFIAYYTVADVAGSWLTMLAQNLGQLQNGNANAKRLLDNTEESCETSSGRLETAPDYNAPAILFDNVTFAYSDEKEVISNLSFSVPKGTKTAIVGTSGCGKSTIIKLLLSLYEPQSGDIKVFGTNCSNDMLAYVPQDCFLLPVSIAENITGDMPFEREKFDKVCRDAGIFDFVEANGYDMVLSESAENISGGQRQRISLARALYRETPIVLLDESTSALDPITEKAVLDSFYASMEGKTALVVAHRIAAITACDRVIVLDGGKIVETGTHSELMKNNSLYAALYEGGE